MVARITITSEELRTASTNFANKAGEIRKILEYLRSEVNRLESTWDGAAQDQFFIHDLRRNGKNNGAVPGSCGWHQPAAECRCADFGRDRSGIDRLSQRLIRQGQMPLSYLQHGYLIRLSGGIFMGLLLQILGVLVLIV